MLFQGVLFQGVLLFQELLFYLKKKKFTAYNERTK